MKISTKGRYALRVMIELAHHGSDSYTPLKEIALKQDISKKYLENIMTILSKAGYVDAVHGKGGGFRLNRDPQEYTIGGILMLTEKSLAPVACLGCKPNTCQRSSICKTLPLWTELEKVITTFFEEKTLKDLLN